MGLLAAPVNAQQVPPPQQNQPHNNVRIKKDCNISMFHTGTSMMFLYAKAKNGNITKDLYLSGFIGAHLLPKSNGVTRVDFANFGYIDVPEKLIFGIQLKLSFSEKDTTSKGYPIAPLFMGVADTFKLTFSNGEFIDFDIPKIEIQEGKFAVHCSNYGDV